MECVLMVWMVCDLRLFRFVSFLHFPRSLSYQDSIYSSYHDPRPLAVATYATIVAARGQTSTHTAYMALSKRHIQAVTRPK